MSFADPWDEDGRDEYLMLDRHLARELDVWIKKRLESELDACMLVTGEPGSGKSIMASHLCKWRDPHFTLKRTGWNFKQVFDIALSCPPYSSVLWDESDDGTNNKQQMNKKNIDMQRLFETIRYKGLFFVICKPTFWSFTPYFAVERSLTLLYMYLNTTGGNTDNPVFNKGYYRMYNREAKHKLYMMGRKTRDYLGFSYTYTGRCLFDWRCHWFFDEDGGKEAYQKAKMEGLKDGFEFNYSNGNEAKPAPVAGGDVTE